MIARFSGKQNPSGLCEFPDLSEDSHPPQKTAVSPSTERPSKISLGLSLYLSSCHLPKLQPREHLSILWVVYQPN
jgi:hypothetical protein